MERGIMIVKHLAQEHNTMCGSRKIHTPPPSPPWKVTGGGLNPEIGGGGGSQPAPFPDGKQET